MRRKILIFSTMFSLMLSFPVMAKPIYTANSSGGYDFYDPDTGCRGHVPNAPITVGGGSGVGNSTVTSEGESTWTEKKDDVSTKNSTVSVTGSSTDNSSKTGTDTVNTSGSSNSTGKSSGTTDNISGNNGSQGTVGGSQGDSASGKELNNKDFDNQEENDTSDSSALNTGGQSSSNGKGSNNEAFDPTESNKSSDKNSKTADYVDADGKIIKEKFTNSIKKVELGKDGKLVIYSYDEDGNVVTETSNNSNGFTRNTYYTDEDGNTHSFSQKVSQSDDYIVEEEFLYYTWDMINLTNNQSKFYGNQVQVAKTTSNSAKVQPDLDGTYKIIGTPWYRKDFYKEITVEEEGDCDEFGNCDTDTYTERVLVDSKIVAKSSEEYTAKVPLFCDGCPIPVICVNGACDCATTLNAICDEANAPELIIKERVELEK